MFSKNQSGSSLNRQLFETYMALDNWHQFRLRLFIEGIFVGIAGGLSISLFRFLLNESEDLRIYLYYTCLIPALRRDDLLPLLSYTLLLLAIGGAIYAMCRYAPMAGGSGIPQVKGVILGLMKMKWLRILWVKILAGAIGIGAGLSLGREGPSIQIGAVAGQGLSRMLGRTRMEERYLITSGASAGLAAAFNAPLAGMMFALEELHRNFSGAVLLPTMTSAITATIVTRCFFGNGTSFHFVDLVPLPAQYLWYVALIALICGLAGIIFNYGLLHIGAFYHPKVFRNQASKIIFALLCAGVLGFLLPQVLGGEKDGQEKPTEQRQEMKTAYIASAFDLIFAAERFNNHRPYVMAGITPMMNLSGNTSGFIKLKKSEVFLELGLGCDFYLPYFKLRPELKFMYGITDTFDSNQVKNVRDDSKKPYAMAAKAAHSKIIALTFYFE